MILYVIIIQNIAIAPPVVGPAAAPFQYPEFLNARHLQDRNNHQTFNVKEPPETIRK